MVTRGKVFLLRVHSRCQDVGPQWEFRSEYTLTQSVRDNQYQFRRCPRPGAGKTCYDSVTVFQLVTCYKRLDFAYAILAI
jgi:hypothetical protein